MNSPAFYWTSSVDTLWDKSFSAFCAQIIRVSRASHLSGHQVFADSDKMAAMEKEVPVSRGSPGHGRFVYFYIFFRLGGENEDPIESG